MISVALNIWVAVWDRLDRVFQQVTEQVGRRAPGMTWMSGHGHTEVFPFRAYASFNNSDKVVDLSVDCQLADEYLVISADIAREEGLILADVPEVRISLQQSEAEVNRQIDIALTRIEEFFRQQVDLVCEELT